MSIDDLLTQTVTLSGPPTKTQDAYGNEVLEPGPTRTAPCYLEAESTREQINGQETVVSTRRLFLLPDTEITALDVVTIDGQPWQVVGDPVKAWDPQLCRVEYTLAEVTATTVGA